MTPYYKDQLERGLLYQDFVYEILSRYGINTVAYSSRLFQQKLGENKAGIEIKFDDKYATTGNLYLEIAEKSNPANPRFIESGIYRDCSEYVIGNYDIIFRLATSVLRLMHRAGKLRSVEIPTSKGVLLPGAEAERVAIAVYRPSCSGQMAEVIATAKASSVDSRKAIGALLSAMKVDPNQLALFPAGGDR